MVPAALTIAGSDPSGGAGLQADLKTFHRFGVYGMSVVTLITVQNTRCVSRVEVLDPGLIREQIECVTSDIPPAAVKTGALGDAAVVRLVAELAADWAWPLVVDPVMISKHGASLLDEEGCRAVRELLVPRAALVTPNLAEAAWLTGEGTESDGEIARAARKIASFGAGAVLIKGGHRDGPARDYLYDGESGREFEAERLDDSQTHGTGCTYAAAITAGLAKGLKLVEAVGHAKAFMTAAIGTAPGLGRGIGPVNHWADG